MSRNAPANPCLLKYTDRSNHETKHPYVLRSLGAHRSQGGDHPDCRNGHPICTRQNVDNIGTDDGWMLMEKRKGVNSPPITMDNCAR